MENPRERRKQKIRFMAIAWKLKKVEDLLIIKDLKETTISYRSLGKKYGVSGQAIFGFCDGRGIKRPRRPKGEHTENCSICQSIIRIAKKPHSDFISFQTIKKQLRLESHTWNYHIRVLRKEGIVPARFGRMRSQKMEQAYQLYFTKRLSVRAIGLQVGLKNLQSAIRQHRAYGWDVPDPLFTDMKDSQR